MRKVKFGDVVNRVNIYVDRFNTERLYYVGKGGSIEPNALDIKPQAKIEGATIGFKFHFGFNPGHILFMSRCFDQHKAATATFAGVCSDSTYVVETRDESVLMQRYLQLVMQTDDFWGWCEEHKSGGVNFLINYSTLETYEFDLPSLDEQRVLADKLWAAYRVKESYRKLLTATDDMVKAKFVEMFGAGECKMKISDVCDVRGGATPAKTNSEFWENGNIPWFTVEDIHDQGRYIFDTRQKITERALNKVYLYPVDTVLLCCTASIGEYAIAKIPMTSNQQFNGLMIKDKTILLPEFLLYVVSQMKQQLLRISGQTTIHFVSRGTLEQIMIPVPPMELQQQFVDIATQAELTKASLRQSIESIDRVIKSLINQ